ncbi:PREDICTED: uncharacterized protein LOC104809403 isoform X2 [Tarenaya hassleriana]|uniref:uncharacterized protein LOC104809403 isoform X2 n=1 Tax=Tarenaya hassleriana TaxID=28532 RepID=UPI00053C88ED|nr:PREDICTED: uncharacterized protein LOC104809403 isoform X2 [Tarenaya hassleriana]
MPGRPRKFNRTKDPHESPSKSGRLSRHGRKMTCTRCKQVGHNAKTCKNEPFQMEGPTRGRGRPRKVKLGGQTSRPAPSKKKKTTQPVMSENAQTSGSSIPTQGSQTIQSAFPHHQRAHLPESTSSLPNTVFIAPRTGRKFQIPRQEKRK